MLEASIFVIFPFCMAFAAVSDLLSMTIANRVSLILVAAFLVLAPLTGIDWGQYGMHIAVFAAVLCATFGLFAAGGMGGGDAKLIAATSIWIGYDFALFEYVLFSALAGGALTMLILYYRKSPLAVYTGGYSLLRNLADKDVGVPYGVALAVGGLIVYPETPLMQWALARVAGA